MGFQTTVSPGNSQQQQQYSHIQPTSSASITRQNSWYSMTLDEVTTHLGDLGKPLGSMDLQELLQNIYNSEKPTQPVGLGPSTVGGTQISPPSSLQRQASLNLAQALSGKSVDDVWSEIRTGQKKRHGEEEYVAMEGEPTMGETTLEDFLVQAGLFAEASSTPQSRQPGVSPSPSIVGSSNRSTSGWKREEPDGYETAVNRRLRRKIKNRESAARSRARKQAYQSELESKVSRLKEVNSKLKKEKEFDEMFPSVYGPKYQLRRTSSAPL